MTQKNFSKIIIAAVLLAALFPSPWMAVKYGQLNLTSSEKNFSTPGSSVSSAVVTEVSAVSEVKIASVASVPSHASIIMLGSPNISGACLNSLGSGSINLNQPANCFALNSQVVQVSSAVVNIQVALAQAAQVKISVLAGASLWFGQFRAAAAPALPALAVSLLTATIAWAFNRKKMFASGTVKNVEDPGINLFSKRLQVLRC